MMHRITAMTLVVFALASAGEALGGNQRKDRMPVSVVADDDDLPVCAFLRSAVEFHLTANERFKIVDAGATLVVKVGCDDSVITATWLRPVKGSDPVELAAVEIATEALNRNGKEATALILVNGLMRRLPWDGEVAAVDAGKRSWKAITGNPAAKDWLVLTDIPAARKKMMRKVTLSLGSENSTLVDLCIPYEVARLETVRDRAVPLNAIGYGVIVAYDEFRSYSQMVMKKGDPKVGTLVFRLAAPEKLSGGLSKLYEECREKIGDSGGLLTGLMGGNLSAFFDTDVIELNRIDQHVGINGFTYHATNGEVVPSGLGLYIANRAQIGDWLQLDFWAMHDLVAQTFTPQLGGQPLHGQFISAEAAGSFLHDFGGWYMYAGFGAFLAKVNTPYLPNGDRSLLDTTDPNATGTTTDGSGTTTTLDTPTTDPTTGDGTTTTTATKSIPARPQILSPNLLIGTGFTRSQIFGDLALNFWPDTYNSHVSLEGQLNHRLTKTWYIGGSLTAMRTGLGSDQAPGGIFTSLGMHIGFDLRRGK